MKNLGRLGLIVVFFLPLCAADAPRREAFSDANAGFSVLLPVGYAKLSEDETHQVFEGLSEYVSKDVSERARQRPPIYFKGPIDPKQPNAPPPSFTVGFSDLDQQVDATKLQALKQNFEERAKKEGYRYGEVNASIVKVDGIPSLQIEHDQFSPINNERTRMILIGIPGRGKWFDLVFNFSPDQGDAVRAAVKDVTDTFKIIDHPPVDVENQNKWLRVLYYTLGFGLAGVLLSFLLRVFTGEKSAGKKP